MKDISTQDGPETPNANSTPEEIASHAYWVWSQEAKSPHRDMNRWMQAAMQMQQHPVQEAPHAPAAAATKTETGKVAPDSAHPDVILPQPRRSS